MVSWRSKHSHPRRSIRRSSNSESNQSKIVEWLKQNYPTVDNEFGTAQEVKGFVLPDGTVVNLTECEHAGVAQEAFEKLGICQSTMPAESFTWAGCRPTVQMLMTQGSLIRVMWDDEEVGFDLAVNPTEDQMNTMSDLHRNRITYWDFGKKHGEDWRSLYGEIVRRKNV